MLVSQKYRKLITPENSRIGRIGKLNNCFLWGKSEDIVKDKLNTLELSNGLIKLIYLFIFESCYSKQFVYK